MPFLDRYWWLRLLGGITMMITTGVAGWTLWQSPIPLSDLWVSDLWGDEVARFSAQNDLLVIGLCILLFMQGISVVRSSVHAHDRCNRRLAALRGDADIIPVAGIPLHPADAPDVTVTPLVLQWAASRATRLIIAPLEGFLCALFLVLPFAVAGAMIYAVQHGAFASLRLGVSAILMFVTIVLVYGILSCVAVSLLVRELPADFGRPFGVWASPEGIASMDRHGKRRFLRWEVMRLLEVTTNDTRTSRTFRVYGFHMAVEWSIPALGSSYPPLYITASEMVERSQSLLDLINARTGLAPRTFDRPSRQVSGKASTVAAIGCIVVLVLATAGFVAGLVFIPVASSHLLNLALIGTVIYILAVVAGAVVVSAIRKPAASEQRDSTEQLPDDVSVSYTLNFGPPVGRRLFTALSGIIMCVDLVPAALWLFAGVPVPYRGAFPNITGIFGYGATLILLLIGLIGLSILIGALRSRVTVVTADATGLTARRGRTTRSIAWNEVERVEGETVGGTITRYTVQGAAVTISWPTVNARLPRRRDGDGVLPISPHGLAQLVAARTGTVLSISKRAGRLGDYQDVDA